MDFPLVKQSWLDFVNESAACRNVDESSHRDLNERMNGLNYALAGFDDRMTSNTPGGKHMRANAVRPAGKPTKSPVTKSNVGKRTACTSTFSRRQRHSSQLSVCHERPFAVVVVGVGVVVFFTISLALRTLYCLSSASLDIVPTDAIQLYKIQGKEHDDFFSTHIHALLSGTNM